MIKNNPSSKQKIDLWKNSNGISWFFLPCWNRSNLANTVEKKNGWKLRRPNLVLDVIWSDKTQHLWNEYMQNTWTLYVYCTSVTYGDHVERHIYSCKSQCTPKQKVCTVTRFFQCGFFLGIGFKTLITFPPNHSIPVGSSF